MRLSTEEFKKLSVKRGRKLAGVEIGVNQGKNALSILTHVPIAKLYLIDAYENYTENNQLKHSTDWGYRKMPEIYDVAVEKLSDYKAKIVWLKQYSHDAVKKVTDLLDFVYIDGNHSSINVKQDIEDYYPLLRSGGILSGHDYNLDTVRLPVYDFCLFNKYKSYSSAAYPFRAMNSIHGCDWWLFKK